MWFLLFLLPLVWDVDVPCHVKQYNVTHNYSTYQLVAATRDELRDLVTVPKCSNLKQTGICIQDQNTYRIRLRKRIDTYHAVMNIELVSNDYNGSIIITHKQKSDDLQNMKPPQEWTCQVNWMFQSGLTYKRYLQVTAVIVSVFIHFVAGQF